MTTSKMKDADLPLRDRIEAAIKRVTTGYGQMRVPVEATDPDVVLADCLAELDAAQKREQAQQAAWDRDWQAAVTAHDKCVAELDAARADRDKFRAGFESSQEQVTILLAARDHLVEQCAQLRSMLHIRTQELDAARARERLKHEALKAVVDGNDIAAERNHSIESWPGSPIRRQAIAALAEGDTHA